MADPRGACYDQSRKRKQPASTGGNFSFNVTNPKRFKSETVGSTSSITAVPSCILNFDGCSKGNPGKAGAGAVLRPENGSWVLRLHEGVGYATNNVAEYRALILGLKYALDYGFTHIRVQGDSMLVCNQIQGNWKVRNPNLAKLCGEAKELMDKFQSFEIDCVQRASNTAADDQANLGLRLRDGEVETRRVTMCLD